MYTMYKDHLSRLPSEYTTISHAITMLARPKIQVKTAITSIPDDSMTRIVS